MRTPHLVAAATAVLAAAGLAVGIAATASGGTKSVAAAAASKKLSWRLFPGAPAEPSGDFSAVVATGPRDAWAAGSLSSPVWHWNGVSWKPSKLGFGHYVQVGDVSASSPTNVWISGRSDHDNQFIAHWDGKKWSPRWFDHATTISGVSTTGPSNAWVVGGKSNGAGKGAHGLVERFDGRKWISVPTAPWINGAVSLGTHDTWAVTEPWVGSPGTPNDILHWDGRTWTKARLPKIAVPSGVRVALDNVVALSDKDVWATGGFSQSDHIYPGALLLHWNGRAWNRVAIGTDSMAIGRALASDGHGGLWLGAYDAKGVERFIHHAAGRWTAENVPAPVGERGSVNGLTLIPGSQSLWAVGSIYPIGGGTAKSAIFKFGP